MENKRRELFILGFTGALGLMASRLFGKGKKYFRRAVKPKDFPPSSAPFSPAVKAGKYLFLSGQIPIDPATGKIVRGDIEIQTRRVLENVKAILKAAGTDLDSVVKVTVFLKDMKDYRKFNEVYASYFKPPFPARSTVQVAGLAGDVGLEMEVIAYLED